METPTLSSLDRLPSGSETVLVVDDDPGVRRVTSRILSHLGYRVLQAQDPEHALRIVLQARVDAVLMDVILPQLNGLALAHTMSAVRPRIKLVYMSGYSGAELEGELGSRSLEGLELLSKPFTPENLARALRRVLDGTGSSETGFSPEAREDAKRLEVDAAGKGIAAAPANSTILLVDDSPQVLASLARILETVGYEVLQAESPEAALEMAAGHADGVRLLVSDVVLPSFSGLVLAHRLSSLQTDLRVLYISGLTDREVLGDPAMLPPTVSFLAKPVEAQALLERVESLLAVE
ncbi:MAG: response regulator [Gemmatimonadota bacterium]